MRRRVRRIDSWGALHFHLQAGDPESLPVHEIQGLKTEVMLQVPMFEGPRGRNIDDQSQEMVEVLYLGKKVTVLGVFVIFCLFMDSMVSIHSSTDRPLLSLSSSFSCSFSCSLLSSNIPLYLPLPPCSLSFSLPKFLKIGFSLVAQIGLKVTAILLLPLSEC